MQKLNRIENKALLELYHSRTCAVCGTKGCDPAHIKTVKSGGHDTEWNVMPLCRQHHTEQHTIGIISFIEKYHEARWYLLNYGWEIVFANGQTKLIPPRL